MPESPEDELIHALGRVARERLTGGEVVPLPGLGTLRVRHEPSRVRKTPEGRSELLPPRDAVVFESET